MENTNLPNRSVTGYMTNAMRCVLTSSLDMDLCWGLVRNYVGNQLISRSYVPVPILTSADYYNQLSVFVKRREILSTLHLIPPSYKLIGNLDYLIDAEKSSYVPELDGSSWDIVDSLAFPHNLRLRLTAASGVMKSLEVVIKKPRSRFVELHTGSNLYLNKNCVDTLPRRKHIYLITEVVLSPQFAFTVQVAQSERSFVMNRDMPIAFRYKKYEVGSDGHLKHQLPTRQKLQVHEARWLRPHPNLPPPKMPWLEAENKRCHRRLRTVLTVAASEAQRINKSINAAHFQELHNSLRYASSLQSSMGGIFPA